MAGWTEWTQFKEENIKLIHPRDTGVYECAKRNRVVYIGKGVIRSRLLRHTQETSFLGVTRFHIRKTTPEEADKAETRLLLSFKKTHGELPEINKNTPSQPDLFKKYLYG